MQILLSEKSFAQIWYKSYCREQVLANKRTKFESAAISNFSKRFLHAAETENEFIFGI